MCHPDVASTLAHRQILIPQALAHQPLMYDAQLHLGVEGAYIVPTRELVDETLQVRRLIRWYVPIYPLFIIAQKLSTPLMCAWSLTYSPMECFTVRRLTIPAYPPWSSVNTSAPGATRASANSRSSRWVVLLTTAALISPVSWFRAPATAVLPTVPRPACSFLEECLFFRGHRNTPRRVPPDLEQVRVVVVALANAVRQVPRRFLRDPQVAVHLHAGRAFQADREPAGCSSRSV